MWRVVRIQRAGRKFVAYGYPKTIQIFLPSSAAIAVLGRQANGWTEWKDNQRRPLDQVQQDPVS